MMSTEMDLPIPIELPPLLQLLKRRKRKRKRRRRRRQKPKKPKKLLFNRTKKTTSGLHPVNGI